MAEASPVGYVLVQAVQKCGARTLGTGLELGKETFDESKGHFCPNPVNKENESFRHNNIKFAPNIKMRSMDGPKRESFISVI